MLLFSLGTSGDGDVRGSGAVNLRGPGTCGGRSWDPSLSPSTPRDNVLGVCCSLLSASPAALEAGRSKELKFPSSGDKPDFSARLVLPVPRARVPPTWNLAVFYYEINMPGNALFVHGGGWEGSVIKTSIHQRFAPRDNCAAPADVCFVRN